MKLALIQLMQLALILAVCHASSLAASPTPCGSMGRPGEYPPCHAPTPCGSDGRPGEYPPCKKPTASPTTKKKKPTPKPTRKPTKKPTKKPTPKPAVTWGEYSSESELKSSNWAAYFQDVYDGDLPPYPVKLNSFMMLYKDLLQQHKVADLPKIVGKCPPKDSKAPVFYAQNNMYASSSTEWIWHPPPYQELKGDSGWIEVTHAADPFGDEHYGTWFMYAKGSGVWYKLGRTIVFNEHEDAYNHFGVPTNVNRNEALCKKAAAANYDTIQFIEHSDGVNYPCHSTTGTKIMNVEIVSVKTTGTYACGDKSGGNLPYLRSGWHSKPCDCANALKISNCGKLLRSIGSPTLRAQFSVLHPQQATHEERERTERKNRTQVMRDRGDQRLQPATAVN